MFSFFFLFFYLNYFFFSYFFCFLFSYYVLSYLCYCKKFFFSGVLHTFIIVPLIIHFFSLLRDFVKRSSFISNYKKYFFLISISFFLLHFFSIFFLSYVEINYHSQNIYLEEKIRNMDNNKNKTIRTKLC